jgi:hypothetical protein
MASAAHRLRITVICLCEENYIIITHSGFEFATVGFISNKQTSRPVRLSASHRTHLETMPLQWSTYFNCYKILFEDLNAIYDLLIIVTHCKRSA